MFTSSSEEDRAAITSLTYLTHAEVCQLVRVPRSTFDDWRAKGRAPKHIRLPNGQLRFAAADVTAWLKEMEAAA